MRRSLALTGLSSVVAAALASAASASIIPLSGTQSLHGLTNIRVNGDPVATGSFDVSAPTGTASWSSGAQSAGIIAAGSHIQLDSSLLSTIGPSGVTLSMTTVDQLTGAEGGESTASLEFAGLFDLLFQIATAGSYEINASIERAAWPLGAPARLTFGRDGQSPIVSLETAGSAWPDGVSLTYPGTTMVLGPGTYRLHADDADTRSGGAYSYLHHSKIRFSLAVVPAPGAAGILTLGLAACAGRRRRQRAN